MLMPIKKLYRTAEVRELDRIAIQDFGIPGYTLMQRAGRAAFSALQKHWPKASKILVICGSGNNAGDGYEIACLAHQKGLQISVLYISEPNQLTGDASIAFKNAQKNGVAVKPFNAKQQLQADVIVDALLGTGLKGEVRNDYRVAIQAINNSKSPILAVDVPSGLNADTGNILGAAIQADLTITFVGCKRGFFTGQAPQYCGEVLYDDLDVPKEVFDRVKSDVEKLDLDELKQYLPPRSKIAHKGDFGHVLVIGGDYGMAGAARMAGEAAARTGSGLTTVATRPEHIVAVSGMCPELMCYGVETAEDLKQLIEKATVLVIGPGLGRSSWSKDLWQAVLKTDKPKVIDADGLNLLVENPTKSKNWILTPHPGEAARLLSCTSTDIQNDRFTAIHNLCKKYAGTCVLKGPGTLVLGESGKIYVCTAGNPGMASGGMGDVLSGIIGGLLAQNLSLEHAARMGVLLHSKSADLAAQEKGERGLLATDLLPYLRKLINT
ncbi:MAG: carbohydrate kinase [Coxiella sp. DG_40]|nr:MAG: carbohydrate kinase [Coxiella sp. DG_40]